MKSICVFSGSSLGIHPAYARDAEALGTELARRNIRLVYGGGNVGLMGACATACVRGGGEVEGFLPTDLAGLVPSLEGAEYYLRKHTVSVRDEKAEKHEPGKFLLHSVTGEVPDTEHFTPHFTPPADSKECREELTPAESQHFLNGNL